MRPYHIKNRASFHNSFQTLPRLARVLTGMRKGPSRVLVSRSLSQRCANDVRWRGWCKSTIDRFDKVQKVPSFRCGYIVWFGHLKIKDVFVKFCVFVCHSDAIWILQNGSAHACDCDSFKGSYWGILPFICHNILPTVRLNQRTIHVRNTTWSMQWCASDKARKRAKFMATLEIRKLSDFVPKSYCVCTCP